MFDLLIILFLTIPFLLIYKELIFNLSTHLPDWLDYGLYTWIINLNIKHFKNLDLLNIFNANIFYPHTGVLLFSDLFFPQSLLALLFSFFTKNPILILNLIYIITFFLNSIAVLLFWKNFVNKKIILFFISFVTLVGPILLGFRGHLQMFSIWPFFLGLSFLFKKINHKNIILLAIMTSVQFYSGVYLGVFLLFLIALKLFLDFLLDSHQLKLKIINSFFMFSAVFLVLSLPLLWGYLNIRLKYHATRDYGEYVQYAADLTDYLFLPNNTWLSQKTLFKKWQSFNQAGHLYPGTVIIITALIGLSNSKFNKKYKKNLFFVIILLVGFIFSLGPRLTANNQNLDIPLPYHLIVKFVPIFEVIRVTQRWKLFVFISLIYFALKGLKKISQSKFFYLIIFLACFWHLLEFWPLPAKIEAKNYYPQAYAELEKSCQQKQKVLLEYPLTEFYESAHLISNLSYKTQMMMASLKHNCYLVNGYSGFIPREYEIYEQNLLASIQEENQENFWYLIDQKNINFIKLNKNKLFKDKADLISNWLSAKNKSRILYQDNNFLVVKTDE